MRQRIAVGIAVLGMSFGLAAHVAQAGPVGRCVGTARQARRQCVQGCNATFQSDFVSCFGPGGQCAQTCISADTSCKGGPLQRLNTCANDPTNPQSCRSQLQAALTACKTDPDPSACADRARLIGFECRQACLDAQKPALDDCGDAFRMCLAGCAGVSTTTTTLPGSPSGAFLDALDGLF
jgi:hypothetical protein